MAVLPNRGRSRAILIGTSRFEHLQDLPAVHNNLRDLRSALTHPDYGVLVPANCEILEDPDSPHTFMTRLRHVAERTDDFLLVYYAGHGIRHDTRDTLCLTLRQSDPDSLDGSSVPFEWIKGLLEHSAARTTLLVLDCCYSGMAVGAMSAGFATQDIEVNGTAVIASSPKNAISLAPVGRRNTAFTGKMVSLLEAGSPIPIEPLTVSSLYKRLSVALLDEKFPRPLLKITNTSGELLVRRPTPPSPTPPPPPETSVPAPRVARPVDTLRSVATAAPVAEPVARGVRGAGPQARARTMQVLWTLLALFVAMSLGALTGVIVGEQPRPNTRTTPGESLSAFLVLTAIVGASLVWLHSRRPWRDAIRALGRPSFSRSRGGRLVLWVGMGFFMAVLVVGVFNTSFDDTVVSTEVSAMVFLVECTALCAHLLFRSSRPREVRR